MVYFLCAIYLSIRPYMYVYICAYVLYIRMYMHMVEPCVPLGTWYTVCAFHWSISDHSKL